MRCFARVKQLVWQTQLALKTLSTVGEKLMLFRCSFDALSMRSRRKNARWVANASFNLLICFCAMRNMPRISLCRPSRRDGWLYPSLAQRDRISLTIAAPIKGLTSKARPRHQLKEFELPSNNIGLAGAGGRKGKCVLLVGRSLGSCPL